MKIAWSMVCLMASLAVPGGAQAGERVETGRLEVVWGDASPNAQGTPRQAPQLHVNFLDERGKRWRLDPTQAQRAAGDLHMLSGKRVGIAMRQVNALDRDANVEVLVPAEITNTPHTVSGMAKAAQAMVSGPTRWITVACRFQDIATEQRSIAHFDRQYGNEPGQLGHYWQQMSGGRVQLTGSQSYGWFVLPRPRSAYFLATGKADLAGLFDDCVGAADAVVDFRGIQGVNLMFNGELDGFAWGGRRCLVLDGEDRCWSTTWNPPWSFNNLAPLAHEMGHGYGLPHSNNSDGDSDTYDNPWDNMSDSWRWAVTDRDLGVRPKSINAFQQDRLGWLDSTLKTEIAPNPMESMRIQLDWAGLPDGGQQLIILRQPTPLDPYATTLYTLEARQGTGAYDSNLPGNAVIIHRVRDTLAYSVDDDLVPANISGNEGSMFKPGERWSTPELTHWVTIESQNAKGFVVVISGQAPRATGGNLPPQSR